MVGDDADQEVGATGQLLQFNCLWFGNASALLA